MRVFISIDVPKEIKQEISRMEMPLRIDGIVLVKEEAMHITLQFLGELSEESIEGVKEAMNSIKSKPFNATLKGISFFSPNFLKVIFVEMGEGKEETQRIYKDLEAALKQNGILYKKEEDYVPHLTIARVKSAKNREKLLSFINTNSSYDFGNFIVKSIILRKSELTKDGPVYTELYKIEL